VHRLVLRDPRQVWGLAVVVPATRLLHCLSLV
jgi:hypothetical protein